MHAGRAQAVAGQRFRRRNRRHIALAEDAADGLDLGHVARDGRSAMRVDIADLAALGQRAQSEPHRAFAALARRRHHVIAVRGRAVAGDFGIDLRAAGFRVFQFLQNHHTAAARDHETVAGQIEGAGRGGGRVVVFRRHRAHRIEEARQRPVQFLAAAGKDDVLLAHLDQLRRVADAMRRGRAGRGDRIVHALDLEGRRQTGRVRGRHAARHHERPHALGRALLNHGLMRFEEVRGGRPARAHDQARARVRNIAFLKPRIADRLFHRQEVIGGAAAHEAQVALVDMVFQHDLRRAMDLAAEAALGIFGGKDDARTTGPQAGRDLFGRVADGADDAQPGDDDAPHGGLLSFFDQLSERATFMSLTT